MEDYSGLKAAIPASQISGGLWGVSKKRRTEDRNPSEERQRKNLLDSEEREPEEDALGSEEEADAGEFRYSVHGMRRKKNHQVDVVI